MAQSCEEMFGQQHHIECTGATSAMTPTVKVGGIDNSIFDGD
jgi:hypothetical protein